MWIPVFRVDSQVPDLLALRAEPTSLIRHAAMPATWYALQISLHFELCGVIPNRFS